MKIEDLIEFGENRIPAGLTEDASKEVIMMAIRGAPEGGIPEDELMSICYEAEELLVGAFLMMVMINSDKEWAGRTMLFRTPRKKPRTHEFKFSIKKDVDDGETKGDG